MARLIWTVLLVLAVIYVVPFIVYSLFALLGEMEPPADGSPLAFLAGVLVSKAGTAVAFVLIFQFGRTALRGRWLLYALLWWVMYVAGEIGQAMGPHHTWMEALAGVISETVYFPAAAFLTDRMLRSTGRRSPVPDRDGAARTESHA
jgi:hypothetical protein